VPTGLACERTPLRGRRRYAAGDRLAFQVLLSLLEIDTHIKHNHTSATELFGQ
jgi:hypothetical protein